MLLMLKDFKTMANISVNINGLTTGNPQAVVDLMNVVNDPNNFDNVTPVDADSVEDNFDLHRKIADDFCDRKAGSNRADRKYSTAYFWYDLDFIRNNNADSACKCGNICEQDEEFDKALLWYDKAAAMWDIAGIKQAGDICFYQMKQKLHSMGYYTKGMFKGDGYCAGMLSKYIFRRCLQVFVVYAAISVIVHVFYLL